VTRVLIAATSSVVRAGLEAILAVSPALQVVGSSATPSMLAQQTEVLRPDVVVAVLEPRGDSPVSSLLALGAETGLPALVLLTDDPESVESVEALRYGARAVLPHDAQPAEIVGALHAAAAGLVALHLEHTAPLLPHLTAVRRTLPTAQGETLTPREIEVLGMLAEGTGNKIIARRLGISEHTVKFHVGSILAKLNASSRTEAVTLGVRQGLILL